MHEAVREAVRTNNYDLIFVYCSSMAQFVPLSAQVPKAIDFVDADSAKWTQYAQYSRFPLSWLYAREGAALGFWDEASGNS